MFDCGSLIFLCECNGRQGKGKASGKFMDRIKGGGYGGVLPTRPPVNPVL